MAMLLDIKMKLPGTGAGTFEDPCEAGSISFDIPRFVSPNRTHWSYKLDPGNWIPCPDPRLGPRWHRYGFEGHEPNLTLPISHNDKQRPCSVTFSVYTHKDGVRWEWKKTVWYYTKSCPFHRSDEEKEQLERQMWLNRAREFARGRYRSIKYTKGSIVYNWQLNSVTALVLYELFPSMITRGSMGWVWKGTVEELTDSLVTSENYYDVLVDWANEEGEKPDADTDIDEGVEPVEEDETDTDTEPDPVEDEDLVKILDDFRDDLVTFNHRILNQIKKVDALLNR